MLAARRARRPHREQVRAPIAAAELSAGRHALASAATHPAGVSPRVQAAGLGKRITDVLVAVPLLLVLGPLFAIVAAAIRLDSPGPVLFRQTRIGQDGAEFTMLKFRSMARNAPPSLHHDYVTLLATAGSEGQSDLRKLTDDPRVTRVGAVIRKASIDEWPQLLNVIAGHMSLVGPRPAVAYELALYRPEHFERFAVRPGMTGLWQVSGRSRLGFIEMLDLDVEYARRHRLIGDLWLLVRTPLAILQGDTA